MSIVAVCENCFSGGQEFAQTLAERLRLRYVDSTTLLGRATALGGDRARLKAALENAPAFFERFTRNRQIQTVLLRAALAEDVREGNAVCYGVAADLLTLETRRTLRIYIQASHRFRRLQVQERLKLHGSEAERYLNDCDRQRRCWLAYLFGAEGELPLGFDLVIHLEQMSVEAAYAAVFEMLLDKSQFKMTDPAPLERFALSTGIRAALALHRETAHLDLDVDTHDDTATVRGKVRSVEELDSIQRVPLRIPTNVRVDYRQIELGSSDHLPPLFASRTGKPRPEEKLASSTSLLFRPAWVLSGISVMILLAVAGSWVRGRRFHPADTRLLSFVGVITDSRCDRSHTPVQSSAECIRSCVRTKGAKYVLNDGAHVFVLTDQRTAERFAAERVMVTGLRDEITGDLHLRSIQAVAQ